MADRLGGKHGRPRATGDIRTIKYGYFRVLKAQCLFFTDDKISAEM